ncbi:MAG TPA: hypothetical protein VFZ65_01395 [Planctomycetota bacterium]|nr:hypothetical protein [Planctomycetota bacterium]
MHRWMSVLLFCPVAVGQGAWLQQSPGNRPAARESHGLAYDPSTQHVYAFGGGSESSTYYSDTWQWDGTNWAQVPTTSSEPFRRIGCCFCSDGVGALMFGGYRPGFGIGGGAPICLGDTWRLYQGQWSQLAGGPLGSGTFQRAHAAMARSNQGVILFGGTATVTLPAPLGDTWRWNGSTWTQLALPVSPPPRTRHVMTFDSTRGVVVLFGGDPGVLLAPLLGDTWEFDGTTWVQRFPAHSPAPRASAAFAYMPHVQKALLFGGTGAGVTNDTWAWDGTDWTLQTGGSPPSARGNHRLAFDEARQVAVLFGGRAATLLDDTYEYVEGPSSYTAFGAGCLGPNGLVPALAAVGGELPRLGTISHIRVSNLPMNLTVPIFVLGTSDTMDPGPPSYALPFDLGVLGWSGCQQLVANQAAFAAATFTGQADYAMTVPLNVTLLGFRFFAQAIVLYLPTGVAVSNAVRGVVGT